MSFARRLATLDAPENRAGDRVPAPALPGEPSPLTARAGPFAASDRGHRDWRHAIAKHLEMLTRSQTATTHDGEIVIAPGEIGARVVRASGALSVSLKTPPAVPVSHRTADGRRRQRIWRALVVIRYGSDTDISWPADISWGRVGYELQTTDDGSYLTGATLAPVEGPPPNPRPSGAADVFEVAYVEAADAWIAAPLVLGAAGVAEPELPSEQSPDGEEPDDALTDPETPIDPSDPGDPDSPPPPDGFEPGLDPAPGEGPFTDPDTGEPVAPETPPNDTTSAAAVIAALHDGSFSVSPNAGATWFRSTSSPAAPIGFSWPAGKPAVVAHAAGVSVSDDLLAWRAVELELETVNRLELENGGFEDDGGTGWLGGVVGWTTTEGDSPRVVDAIEPPAPDGSARYLSRDWRLFTDAAFRLEQAATLDAETLNAIAAGAALRLVADAWAEPHATATIGVRYGELGLFAFESGVTIQPRATFNQLIASSDVSALRLRPVGLESGDVTGFARMAFSTESGGTHSVGSGSITNAAEIRLATIFGDFAGAWSETIPVNDAAAAAAAAIMAPGGALTRGVSVTLTRGDMPGASLEITFPAGFVVPLGRYSSAEGGGIWSFTANDDTGSPLNPSDPDATQRVAAELEPAFSEASASKSAPEWSPLVVDIPAPGAEMQVFIAGAGSPADVYIDNIRLELVTPRSATPAAIATDRASARALVATADRLYAIEGGAARLIGDLPHAAGAIAGHGSVLLVADGASVSISTDGGGAWATHAAPATVAQLLAAPEPVAVLADGTICRVSAGGLTAAAAVAVAGSHIAYDRKRGLWIETAPGGVTRTRPDLDTLPADAGAQPAAANATGERRTVPTDGGRWIGYGVGDATLYWRDGAAWRVDHQLRAGVLSLKEIR